MGVGVECDWGLDLELLVPTQRRGKAVYSTEMVGKSYGDRMGPREFKDFIQSKEFIGNFLGGLSHMEEFNLDIYLASNLEFWSWKSLGISGNLVLTLSFGNVVRVVGVAC